MNSNREILERNIDRPSKLENLEESSRARILTMALEYPEDFPAGFDIGKLRNKDFELERGYQNGDPYLNNELDARLRGLGINSPLNASQRILATVLLKRVIADLIDKKDYL